MGWEYSVSGNQKTAQEDIAFVQTRGDGSLDYGAECWGREADGFKTYFFFEVEMAVPDGSAIRWREEDRARDDSQVSGMAIWIDKWHLLRWGKQHWGSRIYLFVGNRLDLNDIELWMVTLFDQGEETDIVVLE